MFITNNPEEQALIDYLTKNLSGSIEDDQTILANIMNVLAELFECVGEAKIKPPTWELHIQTLIGKILFSSHSILNLSKGYDLGFYKRSEIIRIIDYSSLYILTRALIENYVTLCYLYHNDLSDEEKIFRYKLWEVSGLISRQNFALDLLKEVSPEDQQKNEELIQNRKDVLENEKELIAKIKAEIGIMPEYKTLDKSRIASLGKYGLPRIDSWQNLIKASNLSNGIFLNSYSLFSSYAHSEYLSLLQMSSVSMNASSPQNIACIQISLRYVKMVIALVIEFYLSKFPNTETVYNTIPQTLRTTIQILQGVGKGPINQNQKTK